MRKRLLALLLALALVFGLFGCVKEPEPTTPTQPTEPATEPPTEPAPDGKALYADACALLTEKTVLTWDVVTDKTIHLKMQDLKDHQEQTVTYNAENAQAPVYALEQTVEIIDVDLQTGEQTPKDVKYTEVYADGTLYANLETRGQLSGPYDAESIQDRYAPAVLLDAALYEDVTVAENGTTRTVTFADPTAGETWAVPATAELLEATGEAVLVDGAVKSVTYTVSYLYGSVTVEQTTTVTPRAEALTAAVPEDADGYTAVQCPESLIIIQTAKTLDDQVKTGSVTNVDSIFSQAGGVMRNVVTYTDYHDGDELSAKFKTSAFVMDYTSGESFETDVEETYHKGKYTYQMDDTVPTTQSGIPANMIRDYIDETSTPHVAQPQFWTEVTGEDLGSLYYFEISYSEDFAVAVQNQICALLYNDPTLLNSMASSYTTDELTGYASIDKFTGLFVASGYNYEGAHVIEGMPYVLTQQMDQSFHMPSYGAYYAITEELLPEEEPEQKATPLFYEVTGADGQKMYLFGTIHVGDERTAYLPQAIYDAFAESDALAIECDTEAFDKQTEEDEELSDQVSDLYFYTDGSTTAEHVDEELYNTAIKYMKATGSYSMNTEYMKPSIWSNSIENFYLAQGGKITSEQGVEERLTKLAKEQEKPILEIESSLFQLKMMTGWSEELHELLLEEAVSYSGEEYFQSVEELFEMWCQGDEAALREYLSSEVDTSEMTEEELAEYEQYKELMEEHNTAMSYDRNEGMLEKAIEYLESGDVIFYAVGLAHLLDSENGLVDTLRAAGYTVELVSYE